MTPGERIRARRTELELTQAQLAQAAGLKTRQSVNRIELGKQAVSAEQAQALAPLLKCSAAWLLFGAEVGADFAKGPSWDVLTIHERKTSTEWVQTYIGKPLPPDPTQILWLWYFEQTDRYDALLFPTPAHAASPHGQRTSNEYARKARKVALILGADADTSRHCAHYPSAYRLHELKHMPTEMRQDLEALAPREGIPCSCPNSWCGIHASLKAADALPNQ